MNVFLTGATGFVGRVLVDTLLARLQPGDRVFALARSELLVRHPQLSVLRGSLAEAATHADVLRGCDHVFHLAALASFAGRGDYDGTNVRATETLLSVLGGSQALRCFIFVSTIGAVDRAPGDDCSHPLTLHSTPSPRSAYGRSKLQAETALRASGLPFTIVRPSWVYGPGMRPDSHIRTFARWVKDGSWLARIGFRGRVSVVHVRDLALALCNMIDNPRTVGKTYFAATEHVAIGELFEQLDQAIHGHSRVRLPLPDLQRAVGHLHAHLPLAVANLAVDYLTADGADLFEDCHVHAPTRLAAGLQDVARDVTGRSGVYVITGANGGIGRELARQLDARGCSLVLVDRDTTELATFARHTVIRTDLSDAAEVATLADRLGSGQQTISCLINNAGVGHRGPFAEMPVAELRSTLDVNVHGTLLLTRLLMDRLVRDHACIVNVASSVAYGPLPNMSVYAASKALLVSWSEALAYELRETNRVVTFSPAGTRTDFQRKAGVALQHEGRGLLSPEEVAARLIEAIDQGGSSVIVGRNAKLLQLTARVLPRTLNTRLWGRLFERTR